jgi:hypothetical protein
MSIYVEIIINYIYINTVPPLGYYNLGLQASVRGLGGGLGSVLVYHPV